MLKPRDRQFFVGGQLSEYMSGREYELKGARLQRIVTAETAPGGLNAVNMTASASTNTKGAWVELRSAAGNTYDSYGLRLLLNPAATARDFLVDIGIGAAGSEVVIASNLQCSAILQTGIYTDHQYVPLFIPRGVRVAARAQCSTASGSIDVWAYFQGFNRHREIFRTLETWGAATADSGGTSVDPGAAANTKGAYSQLVAATTRRATLIGARVGGQLNTVRTAGGYNLDLAVGGAGSEVVIVPDLRINVSTTNDTLVPQFFGPFPCDIPAGSRVAARANSDITDATDRLFDLVAYGSCPG